MTVGEQKHPVEDLGRALMQAGGILTSMTNCYEKSEGRFSVETSFIAEAMSALNNILSRANDSLTRLYQQYDLEQLSRVETPETIVVPELASQHHVNGSEHADASYLGFFSRHSQVSRLATKLDAIAARLPVVPPPPVPPDDIADEPAQSYEELVEKLTMMSDAVAYQSQNNGVIDAGIVPMLDSLRNDIIRLQQNG